MTPLRRRRIVATLLKLTRRGRRLSSLSDGPGCTCESCVQAWDRHNRPVRQPVLETRRVRLGLY
jgi:hypothetical protein